mgnify:CR=1 FL=1
MSGPDESRLLAWLRGEAVRADGAVLSWVNPSHPGYAYPEVAGLWLTVLASEDSITDAELERVAGWVASEVDEAGRVGRGEVRYSFDSAIVVVGLVQAARRGLGVDRGLLERMGLALAADLRAGAVAFPAGEARWSTRPSAHLGKLRWAFAELDALLGEDPRRDRGELDEHFARLDQMTCLDDGRIRIRADDPRSYVHASCYALEGMLLEPQREHARLLAGARWLTTIQDAQGSLPNWVAAPEQAVAWPSDVIAQAVRIWARIDPIEFARPIALALDQLRLRQTESGGLSYLAGASGHVDVNVWASLFALQAVRWAAGRDTSGVIA